MGSQMFLDVLPEGVGQLFKEDFKTFLIKAILVWLTFVFMAVFFILCLQYYDKHFFANKEDLLVFDVLLTIILGFSPWTAYHLTRLVLFPIVLATGVKITNLDAKIDAAYIGAFFLGTFSIVGIKRVASRVRKE